MGKPHPYELRRRVVAHVEGGHTHHSAAARFDVSVKFVNDVVKLIRGSAGTVVSSSMSHPLRRE